MLPRRIASASCSSMRSTSVMDHAYSLLMSKVTSRTGTLARSLIVRPSKSSTRLERGSRQAHEAAGDWRRMRI